MTDPGTAVAGNGTALKLSTSARSIADLRQKIDEAKGRLPLPELMQQLGLGEHAKESARCPLPGHEDKHPSFSVFKGGDGLWHFNCFSRCGDGDEVMFLSKLKGISLNKAMSLYLEMAGFPRACPPKSRECHKSLGSHGSPESPVSNGQGLDQEIKVLAVLNRCTERNSARRRRWQLVRDLRAVQKRIGRKLAESELMFAFDEWHRASAAFLDPAKARDEYLAAFLAEFGKVRVPTGEGETLNTARANVSKLCLDGLAVVPGLPNAPETWRRLLSLHRELSRLRANGIYFLSYRDAAEVCGVTHQVAHAITGALVTLGVIKIVAKGKAGLNSRKAAEFRCLLSAGDNGAQADHDGEVEI
jgi:hypothetical protein